MRCFTYGKRTVAMSMKKAIKLEKKVSYVPIPIIIFKFVAN